jgi:hypothetical protein
MYKELVMIKNYRNSWDYIFDVSITELNPIYTTDDAINLIKLKLIGEDICEFIVSDDEIYIITNIPIECKNCGDTK